MSVWRSKLEAAGFVAVDIYLHLEPHPLPPDKTRPRKDPYTSPLTGVHHPADPPAAGRGGALK